MEKKVIAVVVTYNRKELLKECVNALLNQSYQNCNILIIDNASTDGTHDFINNFIDNKKVFYRNTGDNLGGAGGFNYGIKEAMSMGADYIWLMDDDCVVLDHSLANLMVADRKIKKDYGFLASKVLWKDGSLCQMNIQRKSIRKKNNDFESDITPIAISSFVSCFIPCKNIRDYGLPIKDFFIWADDWEYTRRLSRLMPCYLVNKSVVLHKTNSNEGSDISKDSEDRLERYSFAFRNECYVLKREGLFGLLYYFAKCFYNILKVIRSDKKNKKRRIKIILDSMRKGLVFNPDIETI